MAKKRKRRGKGNKAKNDATKKKEYFIADQSISLAVESNVSPDILLDTARGRGKGKTLGQFVPDSCITNELTSVVKNFCKQQTLENPYPAPKELTPNIIGEKFMVRRRKKSNIPFVPESCLTDTISMPANPGLSINKMENLDTSCEDGARVSCDALAKVSQEANIQKQSWLSLAVIVMLVVFSILYLK